ncbi:MAG: uroporphyrinogen decarboxylase [Verrucomicrobia bacterium]|nr:MAG: uroporphyrinogen decarboxylase [Verrucomicrobiota bacterium]
MNVRFQNAVAGRVQNTPPIWLMRQAGRYHAHYQALRQKHSFMDLCKQPELAVAVALGPVQEFDFDVAILFSDILFPLEALGMDLDYTEEGPRLGFHLTADTLGRLKPAAEAIPQLKFQQQALAATRAVLPGEKSLIGFVGGPWTMFVYAVEGSHSGSLTAAKRSTPLLDSFYKTLLPVMEANIRQQLEGGAEVVMLFDTAAGLLSPACFQSWAVPALARLARAFPGRLGYYSRDTQRACFDQAFLKLPWAGMGVDHRWDLREALTLRSGGFVQGNFDQSLLFLEGAVFDRVLRDWLEPLRQLTPEQRRGWVCGLGHGVLPATPEAHVRRFVKTVREVFHD